jgi:hypothetical protein
MSTTLTERGGAARTPRPRAPRRRRPARWIAGILVVALIVGGVYAVAAYVTRSLAPPTDCVASIDTSRFTLSQEQAANATTIAAIGHQMGLPNHAVTIALAAALQESNLRNLSYGDRDSLGLFQQRPSQGWGTPAQLTTPSYAASAFYKELVKVHGWQTMAVTDAAQAVQRSASGQAYAKWEDEARNLAIALTGERPAAFACHYKLESHPSGPAPSYAGALQSELGVSDIAHPASDAESWAIAAWLIAHGDQYRISSVATQGQEWTPSSPHWHSSSKAPDSNAVVVKQA